jgi:hypothetical protein
MDDKFPDQTIVHPKATGWERKENATGLKRKMEFVRKKRLNLCGSEQKIEATP